MAPDLRAQSDVVNEEPDQRFNLRPVAIGDGSTHYDVFLLRITAKQCLVSSQQEHEWGNAFTAGKGEQLVRQILAQFEHDTLSTMAGHCRPGLIRGELENRRSS